MSSSRSDGESRVVLPITPMLDMTFQLLFFFIMNFNPTDLEGQMDLALPANRQAGAAGRAPVGGPGDVDFPADVTVVVRGARDGVRDGEIASLMLRNARGGEEAVEDLAALELRLAALWVAQDASRVRVQGSDNLHVRSAMRVLDACRRAGCSDVALASPSANP